MPANRVEYGIDDCNKPMIRVEKHAQLQKSLVHLVETVEQLQDFVDKIKGEPDRKIKRNEEIATTTLMAVLTTAPEEIRKQCAFISDLIKQMDEALF